MYSRILLSLHNFCSWLEFLIFKWKIFCSVWIILHRIITHTNPQIFSNFLLINFPPILCIIKSCFKTVNCYFNNLGKDIHFFFYFELTVSLLLKRNLFFFPFLLIFLFLTFLFRIFMPPRICKIMGNQFQRWFIVISCYFIKFPPVRPEATYSLTLRSQVIH